MSQNINTKTTNIFSVFPQYTLGNTMNAKNTTIASTTAKEDTIELSNAKKKTRRRILFGSTIASTVLTAGIFGLIFAKGIHGSAFKNKLGNYTKKLADDIHEIGELSAKDIPTKIIYHTKKGMKKFLDLLQASSNITTFKDYGSSTILNKTKTTRAFAKKTTKMFNGIVDRTLGKQYDLVGLDISDLTSKIQQHDIARLRELDQTQIIEIKGINKTLGEWIDELSAHTQNLSDTFRDNFSLGARMQRDKKRMALLSDLPEKIKDRFFTKDKKGFLNPANYKTYATEDLAKPIQEQFAKEISNAKKRITNNIPSITEKIKTSLTSLGDVIKPEDQVTKKDINALKNLFKKFKECSGSQENEQRNEIIKQITNILEKISGNISENQAYNTDEQKLMKELLKNISDELTQNSSGTKGSLEEIMTILKGLNGTQISGKKERYITNEAYKKFQKMSDRISSDLKRATTLEQGEYFMKKAELTVGSAPNDVISVFVPIGAGAYAIAKGDTKEEKVSATLTTCIPLVGTFATFVYGTIKMLSGANNLIFSAVSGALLGIAGDYCDSLYKKSKNPNEVKNVVQDGYDKLWTGLESQIHKFDENEENNVKK